MADLQKFLNQAKYWAVTHRAKNGNDYHKEICKLAGIGTSTAWCAAFVSACSKKSGNTSVIGVNSGAGGVCNTVIKKGGTWIKGPNVTRSKVKPQPGDLLLKVSSKYPIKYDKDGKRITGLHGKHVAVVYKADSNYVYTYEGNYGGKAADVKRKLNDTSIAGYARPKWGSSGGTLGPLYTTKNDRHDMTMREIGYMDSNGNLTKSTTNYEISIINYTTLLGDLFNMFVRSSYGPKIVDTSKLKGNEKIVVEYFLNNGLDAGAACGIAANIKTDSDYNPATFSGNVYYGLCKWTSIKAGLMRVSVGVTSWATDLSGQLNFLLGDIEINYKSLLTILAKCAISADGAAKAAANFAKIYRGISNTTAREKAARAIFNSIVITQPKQVGTAPNPQTEGKTCKTIDVSKKSQKVLSSCWKKFEVGLADTSMINEWKNKGKSTSKGLCYMNKCYLISYNTYLDLKTGDYVELVTDYAGTIPCIVAGGFNDINTPIQFYRDMANVIDLRAWNTAKINQIKNYGKRKT